MKQQATTGAATAELDRDFLPLVFDRLFAPFKRWTRLPSWIIVPLLNLIFWIGIRGLAGPLLGGLPVQPRTIFAELNWFALYSVLFLAIPFFRRSYRRAITKICDEFKLDPGPFMDRIHNPTEGAELLLPGRRLFKIAVAFFVFYLALLTLSNVDEVFSGQRPYDPSWMGLLCFVLPSALIYFPWYAILMAEWLTLTVLLIEAPWFLRRQLTEQDVRLNPFHPDQSGGLFPVSSLALSGVIIYFLIITMTQLGLSGTVVQPTGAYWLGLLLFTVLTWLVGLLLFVLPLLGIRGYVVDQKRAYYAEIMENAQQEPAEEEDEADLEATVRNMRRQIRQMHKVIVFSEARRVRDYPFNPGTLLKFVISGLVPILVKLGTAFGLFSLLFGQD